MNKGFYDICPIFCDQGFSGWVFYTVNIGFSVWFVVTALRGLILRCIYIVSTGFTTWFKVYVVVTGFIKGGEMW